MQPAAQKVQQDGGVAEEKAPVIARSAMQKEEEYAGKYESGGMPEPSIRFSTNLSSKQQEQAQPERAKCTGCGADLREGTKFCNFCGTPVQKEEPKAEEKPEPVPVQEPAQPEGPKCTGCGADLREGAKFCNTCGTPVLTEEPKDEGEPEPVPAQEPEMPEMPAVEQAPEMPEMPAVEQAPEMPEVPVVEQTPAQPQGVKCAACGADLREGAKFCTICGNPMHKVEEPEAQEPKAQEPKEEERPAEPPAPVQQPAAPAIPPVQQPAAPAQQSAAPQRKRPALKKCPLCGAVVAAEAKTCTGCGVSFRMPEHQQPAAPAQQPAAPAQQPAASAGKKCAVCGSDLRPEAKFCNVCGNTVAAAPAQQRAKPPKTKKEKPAKPGKKSKAPLIIVLCVALVLVAALVIGLLTDWYGFNGPVTQIYNATEKTLRAGGFRAEFSVAYGGMEIEGTAECELDIEGRELTALVELHSQGETVYCGIYDGYALWQDPDGQVGSVDVSDMLEPVFDELEEDKSMNEVLEEVVDLVLDSSGMDRSMDADETFACVSKSLSSSAWLKENAGYSTESEDGVKLHVLQPKLGDLALAGVEALESAFEDEDIYEEAVDYLKDYKSDMNDLMDAEVVFGIQSGKLVQLSVDVDVSGIAVTGEVAFEKIGDAKVDTGILEDMLEKAN